MGLCTSQDAISQNVSDPLPPNPVPDSPPQEIMIPTPESEQTVHPPPVPEPVVENASFYSIIPPPLTEDINKKCLVLDLDETLVHSSFKPIPRADYVIPVEVQGSTLLIYVSKRPGVDLFLQRMGMLYEIVCFTASVSDYASPLLDLLDQTRVIKHRLFREDCVFYNDTYVKDLSRLGRPIHNICLIDNNLTCGLFHPQNTIGIGAWFNDEKDRDLTSLIPLLERMAKAEGVEEFLADQTTWVDPTWRPPELPVRFPATNNPNDIQPIPYILSNYPMHHPFLTELFSFQAQQMLVMNGVCSQEQVMLYYTTPREHYQQLMQQMEEERKAGEQMMLEQEERPESAEVCGMGLGKAKEGDDGGGIEEEEEEYDEQRCNAADEEAVDAFCSHMEAEENRVHSEHIHPDHPEIDPSSILTQASELPLPPSLRLVEVRMLNGANVDSSEHSQLSNGTSDEEDCTAVLQTEGFQNNDIEFLVLSDESFESEDEYESSSSAAFAMKTQSLPPTPTGASGEHNFEMNLSHKLLPKEQKRESKKDAKKEKSFTERAVSGMQQKTRIRSQTEKMSQSQKTEAHAMEAKRNVTFAKSQSPPNKRRNQEKMKNSKQIPLRRTRSMHVSASNGAAFSLQESDFSVKSASVETLDEMAEVSSMNDKDPSSLNADGYSPSNSPRSKLQKRPLQISVSNTVDDDCCASDSESASDSDSDSVDGNVISSSSSLPPSPSSSISPSFNSNDESAEESSEKNPSRLHSLNTYGDSANKSNSLLSKRRPNPLFLSSDTLSPSFGSSEDASSISRHPSNALR
ncbi:putative nuclear LIM interactor-interacting factor related [Monocercomonoides exilis]|uniref:putative nuclear LIM interactor-interacting factor related n=1 Tax=Monocercomonoides exilis TaxID=2049356 RepID=UPI00355A94DD|nr:putative nuclear LIM interactor-interacting factor related [Monocercomonoides exilis]|eukprot:MONOS_11294.1-p1 / transcript=MONOS_11294.1 / gene=MONOS_11294 / organism=Monocercomonoides_exilis_PA203 / gene_product=nuclear LIM interactor-interacting factor related / transcript_product=nuclear LIM interactor-interacting factor related / location=Mono_scaffold00559:26324-29003(-) / protein_length=800 / sequence_SO=supercontig / SO=protein_coding / is_pseudo=false